MRFASRYPAYQFAVEGDKSKTGLSPEGFITQQIVGQGYTAKFQPQGWMSQQEINQALDKFYPLIDGYRREAGHVALPAMSPGVLLGTKNTMYEPSNPEAYLSFYDTEWIPEGTKSQEGGELRDVVTAALLSNQALNQDYIQLVAAPVATPWPSYDNLKGAGVAGKVRQIVEDTEVDPEVVIAYEQSRPEPRKSIVEAMRALQSERWKAAETREALSVQV